MLDDYNSMTRKKKEGGREKAKKNKKSLYLVASLLVALVGFAN